MQHEPQHSKTQLRFEDNQNNNNNIQKRNIIQQQSQSVRFNRVRSLLPLLTGSVIESRERLQHEGGIHGHTRQSNFNNDQIAQRLQKLQYQRSFHTDRTTSSGLTLRTTFSNTDHNNNRNQFLNQLLRLPSGQVDRQLSEVISQSALQIQSPKRQQEEEAGTQLPSIQNPYSQENNENAPNIVGMRISQSKDGWNILRKQKRDSQGINEAITLGFISTIKNLDKFSITNGAKERNTNFQITLESCQRKHAECSPRNQPKDSVAVVQEQRHLLSNQLKIIEDLMQRNPTTFNSVDAEYIESEYQILAERARVVLTSLLKSPNDKLLRKKLDYNLHQLRHERAFFILPKISQQCVERQQNLKRRSVVAIWKVEESIFAKRRLEGGLFESEQQISKQLMKDWSRVAEKARFKRLVAREDQGISKDGSGLESELNEIREELKDRFKMIRSIFIYYSTRNAVVKSSQMFQLSWVDFVAFVRDIKIQGNSPMQVRNEDLSSMFVATNFEEDGGTVESSSNSDYELMRFEFLEIIIRLAFARYILNGHESDSSTSVGKLLDDILQKVPVISRLDPDVFRRHRLYTKEMEIILTAHWELLLGLYKLYKARDRCKYMAIEHWVGFLDGCKILGYHTGIEKREAKMIFGQSQMIVVDELKKRGRAVSLSFFDFVEAISRVADVMHVPSDEQLQQCFEDEEATSKLKYWEYYKRRQAIQGHTRRLSVDGTVNLSEEFQIYYAQQQRENWFENLPGLEIRFGVLLEVLVENSRLAWGGTDVQDMAQRISRVATNFSGGIELDR